MKRRLLTIAVFLLLGAIVNVAVAWSSAMWIDIEEIPSRDGAVGTGQVRWIINLRETATATQIERFRHDLQGKPMLPESLKEHTDKLAQIDLASALPGWTAAREQDPAIKEPDRFTREEARGWPMMALYCAFDTMSIRIRRNEILYVTAVGDDATFKGPGKNQTASFKLSPGDGVRYGMLLPRDPGTYSGLRALPWYPLWPGFAINTLFYAAIMLLLFAAPFALRRRMRINRGLCPACAYPVGVSDVCTECGKPLPERAGDLATTRSLERPVRSPSLGYPRPFRRNK